MTMNGEAILLVEDDEFLRRAIERTVRDVVSVVGVDSIANARAALVTRPWHGLVIDVTLPDGSGLDWLADIRAAGHTEPALVLTGHCDRAFVNRAFDLQAGYLCKPFAPDQLVAFARSAAAGATARTSTTPPPTDVASAIRDVANRFRLTPSEVALLTAAVRGVPRKEFVASRGISINTYKTQVRSTLRKLHACCLGDVRDAILREIAG